MASISKINLDGTEYDVGGGSEKPNILIAETSDIKIGLGTGPEAFSYDVTPYLALIGQTSDSKYLYGWSWTFTSMYAIYPNLTEEMAALFPEGYEIVSADVNFSNADDWFRFWYSNDTTVVYPALVQTATVRNYNPTYPINIGFSGTVVLNYEYTPSEVEPALMLGGSFRLVLQAANNVTRTVNPVNTVATVESITQYVWDANGDRYSIDKDGRYVKE